MTTLSETATIPPAATSAPAAPSPAAAAAPVTPAVPPPTLGQQYDAACKAVVDFDAATRAMALQRQTDRVALVQAQHKAFAALTANEANAGA